MDRDTQKREAAEAAAALVQDGMLVGLGTGSTARFAIDALIRRVRAGLRIRAIPTSERSAAQAREGGIPLTSFTEHRRLDLTIDGADEIEIGSLNLIKGAGGALLREKIVAAASEHLVIVADGRKLVERLGATVPVPVEVVPFGWETTADRLRRLGTDPQPRRDAAGQLFCTDGGHRILDCRIRHDYRSCRSRSGHRPNCRGGGNRPVHRDGPPGPGGERPWRPGAPAR